MADYVQNQIEDNQVPMYKILAEYPMEEEQAPKENEVEKFHTDEEAEVDDQEEDMKEYQKKLNAKIDVLVEAL